MAFYLNVSDAQFRAFEAVERRADEARSVLRFVDGSSSTLIAMMRRKWVTLTWGDVDGIRGITSAQMTHAGRKVYADEKTKREQAAAREAVLAGKTTLAVRTVDPWAIVAQVNGADVEIPF
jgi:hypothetical protein